MHDLVSTSAHQSVSKQQLAFDPLTFPFRLLSLKSRLLIALLAANAAASAGAVPAPTLQCAMFA
jgi:hypothetical protein